MEIFVVKANNKCYCVKPHVEIFATLYKIHDRIQYLFTIGLNENGEWGLIQRNDEVVHQNNPEALIKKIGEAIESKTA